MKVGYVNLSKAITNTLEKYAPNLVAIREQLAGRTADEEMIKGQLEVEADTYCTPLLNKRIYELKRVHLQLMEKRNDLSSQFLNTRMEQKNPSNEMIEQLDTVEMQILMLEKAIHKKQEQNRQLSHSVERNFIDHPFISSSSPNEVTLKKKRKENGVLELNKTGFRNLFYQNGNGKVLLPSDARNMLGIFKMWEQKGKNKEFAFEFRELLKCVQADINGGEYEALHDSLDNLGKTSIVMEEYYDAEAKKRRRTKIHNPFQSVEIDRDSNQAHVKLSDDLFKNLLLGNVVSISISLFNDLATPTSKNLYLVVVNKTKDKEFILEVEPLIGHLGINSNEKSKAYSLLKASFEELQNFDVIQSFTILKNGRTPVKIIFQPSDWLLQANSYDEQLLIDNANAPIYI